MEFPKATDADAGKVRQVQASELVMLYNGAHPLARKKQGVTESVKRWVRIEAHRRGWTRVHFIGKDCMLSSEEPPQIEDPSRVSL